MHRSLQDRVLLRLVREMRLLRGDMRRDLRGDVTSLTKARRVSLKVYLVHLITFSPCHVVART